MIRMADSVTDWFEKDEKNVIAVHCKGGKGRTGTMISVALLKTGVCQTAAVRDRIENGVGSEMKIVVHSGSVASLC